MHANRTNGNSTAKEDFSGFLQYVQTQKKSQGQNHLVNIREKIS